MLKKLSLLCLSLASLANLQADSSLFPCSLPPFALAPPDHFASCCDFEGHVDFLYLKGKVSDGILTNGGSASIVLLGNKIYSLKEIYIDWDGGFDVGIGWNFPADRWGLSFDWFHFSSTTSFELPFGNAVKSGLISFAPANFLAPYGIGYTDAYSIGDVDFAMNFNLLELAIKRTFLAGPALSLTPKAGLIALFIRDSIDLTYFSTPLIRISNRQLVNGVGVMMGIGSDWEVGCGFSLYGNFDFAAVSYSSKVIEIPSFARGPSFEAQGAQFQVDQFDPLLRYQLGGRWNLPLSRENIYFSLSLGWEALLFFNQDHFTSYSFSEAKPLSLQGLLFSVALSI